MTEHGFSGACGPWLRGGVVALAALHLGRLGGVIGCHHAPHRHQIVLEHQRRDPEPHPVLGGVIAAVDPQHEIGEAVPLLRIAYEVPCLDPQADTVAQFTGGQPVAGPQPDHTAVTLGEDPDVVPGSGACR